MDVDATDSVTVAGLSGPNVQNERTRLTRLTDHRFGEYLNRPLRVDRSRGVWPRRRYKRRRKPQLLAVSVVKI